MAKYLVVAPDKDTLSIASNYGTQKLKHGSFIYDDNLAKAFPQFFILVPEQKVKKEPKAEVVKEEVKKKPGRPKKG